MGVDRSTLSAPEPLAAHHDVAHFSCGEPALDAWLKRRAGHNERSGTSRTYVVTSGSQVAAYVTLAAGSVARANALKTLQRNAPDPLPVIVLGRLAVDSRFQGHGIGQALLRDAHLRALQADGHHRGARDSGPCPLRGS